MFAVAEKGISYLKEIRHADEYGMQGLKVTKKKLLRRLEWLTKFFKEKSRKTGNHVMLGSAAPSSDP